MSLSKRLINPSPAGGGGGGVWDISNLSLNSQTFNWGIVNGVHFSDDGSKFIWADRSSNFVYKRNLSTPFDITTSSGASQQVFNATQVTNSTGPYTLQDLFFSPDGTKMFLMGALSEYSCRIFRYNLSSPWDFNTISFFSDGNYLYSTKQYKGFWMSPDGTKLVTVARYPSAEVRMFNLSTPWDINSESNTSTSASGNYNNGVTMKPDGTRIILGSDTFNRIMQFDLSTPFDVTTMTNLLEITGTPDIYGFWSNGEKLFFTTEEGTDRISSYDMLP